MKATATKTPDASNGAPFRARKKVNSGSKEGKEEIIGAEKSEAKAGKKNNKFVKSEMIENLKLFSKSEEKEVVQNKAAESTATPDALTSKAGDASAVKGAAAIVTTNNVAANKGVEDVKTTEGEEKEAVPVETAVSMEKIFDQPTENVDNPNQVKVAKIISESCAQNTRMDEDPPLILITDAIYLEERELWPFFALYFSEQGLLKTDSETGMQRAYKFEERFEISLLEGGQWLVFGVSEAAENLQKEQQSNEEDDLLSQFEEDALSGSIDFTYIDEEIITKGEKIEKEWDPVFSGHDDAEYGKDVSMNTQLTPEQKIKYNWDKIKADWKLVNSDKVITDDILNKWIRKNLAKGWKEGDKIRNLKEMKVKFEESTGVPIIQAMTKVDAWDKAGEIGVSRNENAPFYWENTLTGTRERILYNFAPEDVYYNRTHLKLDRKTTYINVMAQILGMESVKAGPMKEKGYGTQFASLVKQTQRFMGLTATGKMTSAVITAFGDRSAAMYSAKLASDKKAKEDKIAYEKVTIDVGSKNEFGTTKVYYKYHNKEETYYVNYSALHKVKLAAASWGSDVDSLVADLKDSDLYLMSFETRISCIKNISSGTVVDNEDERSLVKLFRHILPHEYDRMTNWIKTDKTVWKVKYEIEDDAYRKSFNNLLADRYDFIDNSDFYKMKWEVQQGSFSADSKVQQMPDKSLKTLEYTNGEYDKATGKRLTFNSLRVKMLEEVAYGYVQGEDETSLIDLLTKLPDNPVVAKSVKRDIAKALLKTRIVDEYKSDMNLLKNIHTGVSDKYAQLREALDELFDETGDLFAEKIREKMKNPSSSTTDIEYFGKYGSKNVYKYLTNFEKITLINRIMDGLWEDNTDEQTLIEILQSVGLPKTPVNQNDPSAVAAAREEEEKQKQSFYDDIVSDKYGSIGVGRNTLLSSFDHSEYTTARRILSTMNKNGSSYRKAYAEDKSLDRGKRRDAIRYMSDYDFQTLELWQRENYITLLVELNGTGVAKTLTWTDDAAESAVNKIIMFTPKEQAADLMSWLNSKAGFYNTLKSAIDGEEFTQFHDAIATLSAAERSEPPLPATMAKELEALRKKVKAYPNDATAKKAYEAKLAEAEKYKEQQLVKLGKEAMYIDQQKMESKNVLAWGSGVAVNGTKIKYSNYGFEPLGNNRVKITGTKYTTKKGESTHVEHFTKDFAANELIGVYFLEEMEGIAKEGEQLQMPAINFDKIINEKFKAQVWTMVEFAGLILSFIPFLGAGLAGIARILATADAIIASLSVIINHNKKFLPEWFITAFGFVEVASMLFIFINPGKVVQNLDEQVSHLDNALAKLTPEQRLIPGFEKSIVAMRDVLKKRARTAKALSKSDEADLRKLLDDLERTPGKVEGALIDAIRFKLAEISGVAARSSDQAANAARKADDLLVNKNKSAKLAETRKSMSENVPVTEKVGKAVPDGDRLVITSVEGNPIASPIFASRKQMAKWISQYRENPNKLLEPLTVEKLTPEMHPWFFNAENKLMDAATHPHLYSGTRPLGVTELFSQAGRFGENADEFKYLQALGDLRKSGASQAEDLGAFVHRARGLSEVPDAKALRAMLSKEGIVLEQSDEVIEKMMAITDLYQVPNLTLYQKEMMAHIMRKELAGELDGKFADDLQEFAERARTTKQTPEEAVEEFIKMRNAGTFNKLDPKSGIVTLKDGRRFSSHDGGHFEWDGIEWQPISKKDYDDGLLGIVSKAANVIEEENKLIRSGARPATLKEQEKLEFLRKGDEGKTRKAMSKKYDDKNLAYLEGELHIEDKIVPQDMVSVSGTKNAEGATVSHKPHADQQLETSPTAADIERGHTRSDRRAYDSEVKMLEEILLKTRRNSKGKIKIVSELDMCGSCIRAIGQFKNMRKNIEVELVFLKPYSSPLK